VGEVVLVAQDLAAYGRDAGIDGGLVELVERVATIDGLRRLRLYYLYPREIRRELIDVVASLPNVVDYFDLSLQHAAAHLLRDMKRPGSGAAHLELIERIRSRAPNAALRSSFIIGFPGETDEDVEELADFLSTAQLDWVGLFPFSPEEGTPAASLPNQVAEDTAMERLRYVQRLQDDITHSRNAAQVGSRVEVVVDQVEEGQAVGRSYRQAPEIDGVVLLDRGEPGDWLRAEIVGAFGTDLEAEVLG
jgi:ribosomal protein S12 methylthiotransferase